MSETQAFGSKAWPLWKLAARFERLAQGTIIPSVRDRFLKMADDHRELAAAEELKRRKKKVSKHSRPPAPH